MRWNSRKQFAGEGTEPEAGGKVLLYSSPQAAFRPFFMGICFQVTAFILLAAVTPTGGVAT